MCYIKCIWYPECNTAGMLRSPPAAASSPVQSRLGSEVVSAASGPETNSDVEISKKGVGSLDQMLWHCAWISNMIIWFFRPDCWDTSPQHKQTNTLCIVSQLCHARPGGVQEEVVHRQWWLHHTKHHSYYLPCLLVCIGSGLMESPILMYRLVILTMVLVMHSGDMKEQCQVSRAVIRYNYYINSTSRCSFATILTHLETILRMGFSEQK